MALHGKATGVFVDKADLSVFFNSYDVTKEFDVPECTGFGEEARRYIVGLHGGSMSLTGYWSGGVDEVDEILRAVMAAAAGRPVLVRVEANAQEAKAYMGVALLSTYGTNASFDSPVEVNGDIQFDDGVWGGIMLHEKAEEDASGNGASVDNGAASENGAVAVLHVLELTDTETLDVTIEESDNDSDWTEIIAFAQASAPTSEAKKIATGTTVERYIRATFTLSDGAATFVLGFARR